MKVCPTCGAGAFDDAEVCYGCLHRYQEGGPGQGPGAPDAGRPRPVEAAGVAEAPAAVAAGEGPALRAPLPSGAVAATLRPEVLQPTVAREASGECGLLASGDPSEREAAGGVGDVRDELLFGRFGWTVRFELPGFAPLLDGEEGSSAGGASRSTRCALLRQDAKLRDDSDCGLIIRFQPEAVREAGEGRRRRPVRGSHAKAAAAGTGGVVSDPDRR
ncbi:hypothetical protein [Rubneribacter sp.]|nr:hypothetical protein [Candidatus Rubneribacter avistercoris]